MVPRHVTLDQQQHVVHVLNHSARLHQGMQKVRTIVRPLHQMIPQIRKTTWVVLVRRLLKDGLKALNTGGPHKALKGLIRPL